MAQSATSRAIASGDPVSAAVAKREAGTQESSAVYGFSQPLFGFRTHSTAHRCVYTKNVCRLSTLRGTILQVLAYEVICRYFARWFNGLPCPNFRADVITFTNRQVWGFHELERQ